ncbi:MAG TPA: cation-translocating P-type ATPase [Steroidobacteraceae bacterium]
MSAAETLHARWSLDDGQHEHVVFLVEGMRCAGCARNIEKVVRALPDIENVSVNAANARVSVDWRGRGVTTLPRILSAVDGAGFRPVPLAGNDASQRFREERRIALKRLGLASIGMMQSMMYLAALYGVSDIDAAMAQLMRVAGMVIVTPVLFYSGAPILQGAWRDLSQRRVGMDVPVALALLLAWLPSVMNTFRGTGEVYFDSVGMFVFFLTAGRFLEMKARHRGATSAEALARSLPAQVTRLLPDGGREQISASALIAGDRFLVPKGDVIAVDARLPPDVPADFVVLIDESLLTGESCAVRRGVADTIRGGSVNIGNPLTMVAVAAVGQSTLAAIVALQERARTERPRLVRLADRAASWFVAVILCLALATGVIWWVVAPERAFSAVLAVLVVTCPCALSLAMPMALAAANTRLARLGVLVTRADAIERLARIDTVIFDKTGTLTLPVTGVSDVKLLSGMDRERVLAIAAALERDSAHPLATAFRSHERADLRASAIREVAGAGIEGSIGARRWRLGKRDFVEGSAFNGKVVPLRQPGTEDATLYLGSEDGLAAALRVGAPLRPEAARALAALRSQGLGTIMASGDSAGAVQEAARALGIRQFHSRLTPSEKIWLLHELRSHGHRAFMIGDGINDGPVLAAAEVSCAMGQGSAIAHSAADLLLVNENLEVLPQTVRVARNAMRVVRQNLTWSLVYNFSAVPAAALGFISPWLAALGMSLSSLAVVMNARRLASQRISA